jgi:hypothetical protein
MEEQMDRQRGGRADKRTNIMQLIGASCDYANVSKDVTFLLGRDLAGSAGVNVDPPSLCHYKGQRARPYLAIHGIRAVQIHSMVHIRSLRSTQ